mgnify:CR=1 FL=1
MTIVLIAALLYLIATLTLGRLGFEHNLYLYGAYPPTPLSDMNGQGDYAVFAAWLTPVTLAVTTVVRFR